MYVRNLKTNSAMGPVKAYVLRVVKRCSTILKESLSSDTRQEHLKVGETYHGFTVTEITPISVFALDVIQLRHEKTHAKYVHLMRNDSNNVFSVNFRTTPRDHTGKPHILEHTVLCGSKRYPVRDPFFKMLNRSLATFMNAMTGPDYTMYPFSTTNETDYRNLQSIYLDAVFNPHLKQSDFMQEGWRLQHVDLSNPHSDIVIKGVVYNEMKGAFAENERILGEKLLNLILPDHTYGVISGGDPLHIPSMTWQDLKDFHRQHYHPSNCRFFSYGNFPLLPTLETLNMEYLQDYSKIDVRHTEVPPQRRWNEPQRHHVVCRLNDMGGYPPSKQNTIVISYLMTDITDVYNTFLMQFLSELLMKGPNSPFYKALIEPNISGGYSPSSGYDNQSKDTVFTLGLQGVEKQDYEKVVQIFDRTIDEVVKNGFSASQIETVLHGYELSIMHEASNFGLRLLFGLAPLMNHNANVTESLRVNKTIRKLKHDMKKNPRFLQEAVDMYFKKNTHRLILTMSPDSNYDLKLREAEQALLNDKLSQLNELDRTKLFELGLNLQREQNEPQNTEVLPTLKLSDIKRTVPVTKAMFEIFSQIPVQVCEAPTNGVSYLKMILNTSDLVDPDHRMLLPLFNHVITKLGTEHHNYREFDTMVNKKTSGLSFSTHIVESLRDHNQFEQGILLSSYCLDGNLPEMFHIWAELLAHRTLSDVSRFELLTKMYIANLTHGIADSGHVYAMQVADSLVSGAAYERDLVSGLRHIKYMKEIVESKTYAQILAKINEMAGQLFSKDNFRIAVNTLPQNRQAILHQLEQFVGEIPGRVPPHPNTIKYQSTDVLGASTKTPCQHNVISGMPVYFCAKTVKTVSYMDEEFPQLRVLARLLTAKYLHPLVREKNGAYGGGARLSLGGLFGFYSYRDPNNFKTLEAFDGSHDYILANLNNISEQDLFEAKLSLFQNIDTPIIPAEVGSRLFLHGLTDELLANHRERIINVGKRELLAVAERYLSNQKRAHVAKAIIGPKLESHPTKNFEDWKIQET